MTALTSNRKQPNPLLGYEPNRSEKIAPSQKSPGLKTNPHQSRQVFYRMPARAGLADTTRGLSGEGVMGTQRSPCGSTPRRVLQVVIVTISVTTVRAPACSAQTGDPQFLDSMKFKFKTKFRKSSRPVKLERNTFFLSNTGAVDGPLSEVAENAVWHFYYANIRLTSARDMALTPSFYRGVIYWVS